MKLNKNKQVPLQALIMYMISALLFLSSNQLHIHSKEAADYVSHGSAISITDLSNNLIDIATEIEVSPDGMLKVQHGSINLLAVFLLLALTITSFIQTSITRQKKAHATSQLPFYGTPSLRAPPLNS